MGKDVNIFAVPAQAFARAPVESIQHHCPLCDQTFTWEELIAHRKDCIKAHPEKVRQTKGREG